MVGLMNFCVLEVESTRFRVLYQQLDGETAIRLAKNLFFHDVKEGFAVAAIIKEAPDTLWHCLKYPPVLLDFETKDKIHSYVVLDNEQTLCLHKAVTGP